MRVRFWGGAVGVLMLLAGGGCGMSLTAAGQPRQPVGGLRHSLIMPGSDGSETGQRPAWRVDAGEWEYGRNDAILNAGRAPLIDDSGWALIRTSDQTRTSNGTPRESSSTFVRTVTTRQPW